MAKLEVANTNVEAGGAAPNKNGEGQSVTAK